MVVPLTGGLILSFLAALSGCGSDPGPMSCESDRECEVAIGVGSTCDPPGFCSEPGRPVDGVSPGFVRTVGIADVSGALSDLGEGMRDGVLAAFAAYNDANPAERQFLHEVRDDAYDPMVSVEQLDDVTRDNGDGVGRYAFAIVGSMGSPTSSAMLPAINERQVPLFGTYSGATHLRREPPDRMVWNTRASYRREAETITAHLLTRAPDPLPKENLFAYAQSPLSIEVDGIADLGEEAADNETTSVLDPYGYSGYLGMVDALEGAGLGQTQIPLASYRATSTNSAVAQQYFFEWVAGLAPRVPGPQVTGGQLQVGVVMVPVASAATTFVQGIIDGALRMRDGNRPSQLTDAQWAMVAEERKSELEALKIVITSISPVGDQLPANLNDASGERIYCTGRGGSYPILVSQVVPFPAGGSVGAIQFREELEAFDRNLTPGYVNFEGWIAGRTWIAAVERTEGELTTESLLATLEGGNFSVDLGIGAPIAFGLENHDGSDTVYGSVLNDSCEYEEYSFE